jgi:hypothetical protein
MMKDGMRVPADKLIRFPSGQSCRSRIDECKIAIEIKAANAFAGGVQDQLIPPLSQIQLCRPFPHQILKMSAMLV